MAVVFALTSPGTGVKVDPVDPVDLVVSLVVVTVATAEEDTRVAMATVGGIMTVAGLVPATAA